MRNVCLIGAGVWGNTVARRISQADIPARISHVIDQSLTNAEHVAYAVGAEWGFQIPDAKSDSDIAIIAVPPDQHWVVFEEVVAAGYKTVRVEKPLASSYMAAREIKHYADTYGISVQCGFTAAASPEMRWLQSRLEGVPVSAWFSYRRSGGEARSCNDAMLDLGSHDIASAMLLWTPADNIEVVADFGGVKTACGFVVAENGVWGWDLVGRVVWYPDGGCKSFVDVVDPLGVELQELCVGVSNLGLAVDVNMWIWEDRYAKSNA